MNFSELFRQFNDAQSEKRWYYNHNNIENILSKFVASNESTVGLTNRGRVAHICVGNLTTISSDNGLSHGRRQADIWTNAGILLIWPFVTNFSEMLIEIHTYSFRKMYAKISSAKWRPSCLGLNVLNLILCMYRSGLSNASSLTFIS